MAEKNCCSEGYTHLSPGIPGPSEEPICWDGVVSDVEERGMEDITRSGERETWREGEDEVEVEEIGWKG